MYWCVQLYSCKSVLFTYLSHSVESSHGTVTFCSVNQRKLPHRLASERCRGALWRAFVGNGMRIALHTELVELWMTPRAVSRRLFFQSLLQYVYSLLWCCDAQFQSRTKTIGKDNTQSVRFASRNVYRCRTFYLLNTKKNSISNECAFPSYFYIQVDLSAACRLYESI